MRAPISDLLIVNGTVLTIDACDRTAEAVAVVDGRIAAVGTNAEIARRRSPNSVVVDLAGRTLIPGLTDSHVHLADEGAALLRTVDVRDLWHALHTVADLLAPIARRGRELAAGEWILATGSPLAEFRLAEKRLPHRRELDAAAPNHPCVVSFGAHIIIANSQALALAGVTPATAAPLGGTIEVDAAGELTGRLTEKAQYLVRSFIPEAPGFDRDTAYGNVKLGIAQASRGALARGVTSVHDIVRDAAAVRAYQELALEGDLPLRTSLLIRVVESPIGRESLLNLGLSTGFGDDWLRIGGVKISIDGGTTGKASAFYEPYVGSCDCGLIRIPLEDFEGTVDAYHRAGHRICIHAMGDRALDMTLDAFEKTLLARPRDDHRHRIEHAGNWMMTPERLARFLDLKILPVPNMSFMSYVYRPLLTMLGSERLRGAFGLRTLFDAGIPVTCGSDGPGYWPADPLRDIAAAVTRTTRDGDVVAPDEAIGIAQALRMCTGNAAFNGFDERVKGSIEAGKLADFAVLTANPLLVPAAELAAIEVDATIVGGCMAFQRDALELRR